MRSTQSVLLLCYCYFFSKWNQRLGLSLGFSPVWVLHFKRWILAFEINFFEIACWLPAEKETKSVNKCWTCLWKNHANSKEKKNIGQKVSTTWKTQTIWNLILNSCLLIAYRTKHSSLPFDFSKHNSLLQTVLIWLRV